MSKFAKIDENMIVVNIIIAEQDFIDSKGVGDPKHWIEYDEDSVGHAKVGYTYDKERNVFIAPQPFPSWVLDEDVWQYDPPIEHPDDGKYYEWNEDTTSWDEVDMGAE